MAEAIQSNWWALIGVGLFVGGFAGLFGLGGGAVIVPLLVLLLKFDQRTAQGTSLAMILSPQAAPAIWSWHKAGNIKWDVVLLMAPTMFIGSYFGAKLGQWMPQHILKVSFAFVLTYIAAYMIFSKLSDVRWAVVLSLGPALVLLIMSLATGTIGTVRSEPAQSTSTAAIIPPPVIPAKDAPQDSA